jgi:uncharacterized SAM-binding protein YcdF (DUF218 family)
MAFRRKFRIAALVLLVIACALAVLAFRGAGRWLIREDALAPADEIAVLNGGMPARAEEAGKVFREGYAREIWVSQGESPRQTLESQGIHYLGEEDYDRAILLHEGVPEADVHIFPQPIVNTEDEVREISAQMRRDGKTSVIIVTSPQHTRRVRTLWRKLAGNGLKPIVHGAPEDPFDPDHWWRDTHDVFSVVREYLGLLNAWLGLPVRPPV